MARSSRKRPFGKRRTKNKGVQNLQNIGKKLLEHDDLSDVGKTLLNEVNKVGDSDTYISTPIEESLYSIVKASSSNDIRNQFIPQLDHFVCKLIRQSLWLYCSDNGVENDLHIEDLDKIDSKRLKHVRKLVELVKQNRQDILDRMEEVKTYSTILSEYNRYYGDAETTAAVAVENNVIASNKGIEELSNGEARDAQKEESKEQFLKKNVTRSQLKREAQEAKKAKEAPEAKESKKAKEAPEVKEPTKAKEAKEAEDDDNALYCTCQQPSSGKMIACDNPNCPIEWYHYKCTNLHATPKGNWFCDLCKEKQPKNRVGKKNVKKTTKKHKKF